MKKFLFGATLGAIAGALGYKALKDREEVIEALAKGVSIRDKALEKLYGKYDLYEFDDDYEDFDDDYDFEDDDESGYYDLTISNDENKSSSEEDKK